MCRKRRFEKGEFLASPKKAITRQLPPKLSVSGCLLLKRVLSGAPLSLLFVFEVSSECSSLVRVCINCLLLTATNPHHAKTH
ncbi:unnamed protein product [Caenorhabditis nigoni]